MAIDSSSATAPFSSFSTMVSSSASAASNGNLAMSAGVSVNDRSLKGDVCALLSYLRRRRSRFGLVVRPAREHQLLIDEADADQRDAEAEEGQGAQDALEAGEIEQEDLEHRQRHQRRGGEPRRLRLREDAIGEEEDSEAQPQCRIGVEF